MGKDFFDSEPVAKQTFETVDKALGYNLSEIIFNGPSEELSATTNTQPAIMAVSVAILRTLLAKANKPVSELCAIVAGHSLGEYSALCAAEVIKLEDTAKLLKIRANAMQQASPKGEGGMAACIGVTYEKLQEIINNLIDKGVCQIANDNVEGQIVISGHEYNIDRMVAVLKDTGYKAIKLNVSAPFHSQLIKPAEKAMQKAITETMFAQPVVPVIPNVTVIEETNTDRIKENLLQQICAAVRWRETMDKLASLGITELVEIGPGKVLSGLAKKSPHNFNLCNIATVEDLGNFLARI
ncbi:MAG: ACP S-malonyltransferase [Rickettsiaceae bacterium]